jgi:hypothetical protein
MIANLTDYQQNPFYREPAKKSRKIEDKVARTTRSRACFVGIIKPQRFINPFCYVKFPAFGSIGEMQRKIVITLDGMFEYFLINSIAIRSSLPEAVKLSFTEDANCIAPSIDYLVARLKSFGDSDYLEWANAFENYTDFYKSKHQQCLKEITENPSGLPYMLLDTEAFEQNFQNKCGIWMTILNKPESSEMVSLHVTTKWLEALKYEKDAFIQEHCCKGWTKVQAVDDRWTALSEVIFKFLYCMDFSPMPVLCLDVIDAQGDIVSIVGNAGSLVSLKSNGDLEMRFYLEVTSISSTNSENQVPRICSDTRMECENPEFTFRIESIKEERDEFLGNYYGLKNDSDNSIDAKTCKVRELMICEEI